MTSNFGLDFKIPYRDESFNYDSSICFKNINNLSEWQKNNIKWFRPKDIVLTPKLGFESSDYKDLKQGLLDNCAFVSACASISKYPNIIKQIFPKKNDLYGPNYNGKIELCLWIKNQWTWVFIDDQLPTIDKKLCFAKHKNQNHFWIAILEKAVAKLHNGYENLEGIDSAYILICLTGGIALRFNPIDLNDKEALISHLKLIKQKNIFIGILGCDIGKKEYNKKIGHSFALINLNINNTQAKDKISFVISNSQESVNIKFSKTTQGLSNETNDSETLEFSFEEICTYFEIFTLVILISQDKKLLLNQLKWDELCNINKVVSNYLTDAYLKSPHIVFEVKQSEKDFGKLCKVVFNLIVEDFDASNFISFFVLPVKKTKKEEILFCNLSLQKQQTFENTNPFCDCFKLLPGIYLLYALISSTQLLSIKKFNLLIATLDNETNKIELLEHRSKLMINEAENSYLINLIDLKKDIKIILSKCCICKCFLNESDCNSYIISGAKIFCHDCYNATYTCQWCNKELKEFDYYTFNQRIYCQYCIDNIFK